MAAQAADKYWIGNDGAWTDPGNWDPYGIPNWDNVYLTQADSVNRTIRVMDTGSYLPSIGALYIDAIGSGAITLEQSGNVLFADRVDVGVAGAASYRHTGGELHVMDALTLGQQSGSRGEYILSESDTGWSDLRTWETVVGGAGQGLFSQSGGHHSTDRLLVGSEAGSNGTYRHQNGDVCCLGVDGRPSDRQLRPL
ncbi:hypothetical protein [Thiohalobacter thiocyanaticus]|uniref:Uncharacterized protein n=1 Tax=Thiohalobacter thiocyanaticus TaxID=585455 RepID=A0A426QJD2_9GAMM|nr:hypothetical protein [Thiohalobacter thiocyanaticus]RRQ21858.1 hypothetical protein D6C00_07805 [Thiohalobacter thiocyanaticus]